MDLLHIGLRVRARRQAIGLSQERLAKLCGLSRATVNQLETGALVDLGATKLAVLLDLVGLRLDAVVRAPRRRGLLMASRSSGVSYKTPLGVPQLTKALVTGALPAVLLPQLATFLDEVPLSVVVSAVEEAATLGRVPPRRIWRHLLRWAGDLHSPRRAWA